MGKGGREHWVDAVKIVACTLVVLGHFFQSMTKSGILVAGKEFEWFNKTIYYFHVPLFFICSGYLYQKYSRILSVKDWSINILKKLLTLGVPYFIFSILTWVLKKTFEASVNNQIGGFFETIFIKPASPYWYLYVLFFFFVIYITFDKTGTAIVIVVVASILKVLATFGIKSGIYVIDGFMNNSIWFVSGMVMAYFIKESASSKKKSLVCGIIGGVVFSSFILLSIPRANALDNFAGKSFLMGVLACCGVVLISMAICMGRSNMNIAEWLSKYTFPVFLMHTLFAAPLRSVLIKLGIHGTFLHVALGLIISFIGPIIAMIVMEKVKPLDFLVYPGRYIKVEKRSK